MTITEPSDQDQAKSEARTSTESDRPIFVVGMPRSGTTLLESILASHPDISITPETHFLHLLRKKTGNPSLSRGDSFERFWRDYVNRERFTGLKIDRSHLERMIRESGGPTPKNVFKTLMLQYAAKNGKRRWGEKTPSHLAHLDTLFSWFPGASILVMIRDPRAISCSLLDVHWRRQNHLFHVLEGQRNTRFRRVYHDARNWELSMSRLASRKSEERLMAVRYEDLVLEPGPTINRIFTFLGEEYDSEWLERRSWRDVSNMPDETARDERAAWRRKHITRASGPIQTNSLDKWVENLSLTEIRLIEGICGVGMAQWGYLAHEIDGDGAAEPRMPRLRRWWSEAWWRIKNAHPTEYE